MRINKLLSNSGFCSRRETNRLIEQNRITVNGGPCRQGQWVEEDDIILIDGKLLPVKERVYIALNKPPGITCTSDREYKGNIIDFVNYPEYIFPVGRLDKDSQGLIILTNDGELSNRILESENEHEKEYIVTLDRPLEDSFLRGMSRGVDIGGVVTKPCRVERISGDTLRIILTQGLFRQIRRMSRALGYKVVRLERIRILNIELGDMEVGAIRHLSEDEVVELRRRCGVIFA